MTKRKDIRSELRSKVKKIISMLKKEYPEADTELRHSNPLEMLVATILSAQCTDRQVNQVTKVLFKKYRTPGDYARLNLRTLQKEIRSTGFFRNKAKNIKASARMLIDEFDSEVPKTMEELLQLPGVARKTANIVLQKAHGVIEGIAVDTHVKRLSQRLGLSKNKDPKKIEPDLMQITPKKDWARITDLLIFHGRRVCRAPNPSCQKCILRSMCPSASQYLRT